MQRVAAKNSSAASSPIAGLRDQLVLATKFTFHGGEPGNPNAGGNGRKNLYRAIARVAAADSAPGVRWLAAFWLASISVRAKEPPDRDGSAAAMPSATQRKSDRNWHVFDALRTVAAQVDRPLAQVALAWASAPRGITSPILGASKLEQLHDNLDSLEICLTPEQLRALDESSALDPAFPYSIFTSQVNRGIFERRDRSGLAVGTSTG